VAAAGGWKEHTMIKSIFHVNINVKDFDRSLAFYQMLGFKVAFNIGEGGNKAFEEGLKIPNNRGKAALLMLGDDPRATRIDLIEWKVPKTEGEPYPHLWHTGVARIAFHTKDIDQEYERLKTKGIEFMSTVQTMKMGGGTTKFVCFKDPDGQILELIEFPKE
jgi:glyoxylase I family protein